MISDFHLDAESRPTNIMVLQNVYVGQFKIFFLQHMVLLFVCVVKTMMIATMINNILLCKVRGGQGLKLLRSRNLLINELVTCLCYYILKFMYSCSKFKTVDVNFFFQNGLSILVL